MSDGNPRVALADGFAQLVAHVFAHVALEQAGNSYDSRYLAWARECFSAESVATLEHDAALIAERWRTDRRLDVLHGMFALHRDLDAFRRTCARSLAELENGDVRSPGLLALLRADAIAPIAELLHTTLALLADEFSAVLARVEPQLESARTQLEPLAARLATIVPGFEDARIELVWALGMHGRVFRDRILVGAPASWCGCSPERQAILAAHEHCVRACEADDYVSSEWSALTSLARQMSQLDDLPLRDAHASWLAQLDLDGLLRRVVERAWLPHDEARALLDDPPSRARRLAQTAWTCSTLSSPGTPTRSGNP